MVIRKTNQTADEWLRDLREEFVNKKFSKIKNPVTSVYGVRLEDYSKEALIKIIAILVK